jgi:molybdopterin/thiamine biosynthesis adenylyltransferase
MSPSTVEEQPAIRLHESAFPREQRSGSEPGNGIYDEAFSRNLGLISSLEQERLRSSHVAIAGMGGVGGVHLVTLARLGIGKFSIADPDTFEVGNFNRQVGATTRSVGRGKAEVMAEEARAINPDVKIRVFAEAITPANVDDFLAGTDVYVDGVDFFSINARRLLFRTAQELGIWGVTAAPLGCSTAWLSFDPQGMRFDRYFDFHDGMEVLDQLVAFAVGLAPRATQRAYMDMSKVNLRARTGPSLGLACQLCSGVTAAEIIKIILRRGKVVTAPEYAQFDAFTGQLRRGRLWWGNRNPWQRLKRHYLKRFLALQKAALASPEIGASCR